MKTLPYWVQRADFTATDHQSVDVDTALRVFDAHPWQDELTFASELEIGGHDFCPPGIGFVDPDGPILHVCPGADGTALVHYHVGSSVRSITSFTASTTGSSGSSMAPDGPPFTSAFVTFRSSS